MCADDSKINGTPKDVYVPNSKLHSISAEVNILAHNNRTIIYVQVYSVRLKQNVAFKRVSKHLWGTIYFAVDCTYASLNLTDNRCHLKI